jgi:dipeptidyl aminopeptidase/acylaminoacyl peptidase
MLHARGRFILKATQIGSGAPDLYEMDVYSGSLRKLAGNTGHIYHYVVNEDGQPLYALEARGGRTNLLEWNGEGGWRPQESIEERFNPIGMLPGNRYLLVSMGDGRGFRGVNLLDLETGTFPNKPSFYPGYDIPANRASKPIIDNLNGYFVGIRFHHEKPENMWFISGPDRVEQLLKRQFEGFDCEFLGFNPEDKLIYFTISKDTHPPVIIQLDIGTGKPSAVHHQFPDLIGMEFRPVKPVSFKHDNASFPIHGYLTLPEGPGPYPTVLLVHGGPRTRDTWGFEPKVQLLALNGYAVLQVNYRGSSGYGRRYGLRSLSDTAEKSVDDVIAGARWLVAEGIADPDRLAVMGGSFGGFISLEAAARAPDLWQAVIGYAGLYDLNAIHKQDDRRGYLWVDDMYADFDEERYAALSPVNHAGSIKAPVLIVHGKSDRRIGLAQAKDMVRALKKSGNEVESMYIRWGVHGLPEEKDRKKYFNNILSWLEQHLK